MRPEGCAICGSGPRGALSLGAGPPPLARAGGAALLRDERLPPRPCPGPQLELLVGQKDSVERRADLGLLHVRADEDELLSPVAVTGLLVLCGLRWPLGLRHRALQPLAPRCNLQGHPRLAPIHGDVVIAGRPQEALRAQHARKEALPQQAVQAVGVEGAVRAVDEAGDAILLGLRLVAPLQLLDPPGQHARRLHVEAARVQQHTGAHHPELALNHSSPGVELLKDSPQAPQLHGGHEVHLVEDQDVGKLHLVNKQVNDGSLVSLLGSQLLPVDRPLAALIVVQKVLAVDDGDERVQARDASQQRLASLALRHEGGGDGHRLGDARALDDQVLEAALERQRADALDQVLAERAADAAVVELHHLVSALLQLHPVLQQLRVDVDGRHVVDQHGDAHALPVVQQVRQQRRLACAEEAAQHGDGQLLGAVGCAGAEAGGLGRRLAGRRGELRRHGLPRKRAAWESGTWVG
mmetsp:Transcript_182470/g.444150  ORF Transcript_182470/g.444150 Transcript_182470/m.444150 type:complete len:467 (-) Transcript_182470:8-1408(-)